MQKSPCPPIASNSVAGGKCKIKEPLRGKILINANLYQTRYNKASKCARLIIMFVPFAKAVIMTGSMATKNITEKSDIDFFIQAKKGRIWTVRFLSNLLTRVLGQKRHDRGRRKKIAGRICLNWYGVENLPEERCFPNVKLCSNRLKFQVSDFMRWILSDKLGDWFEQILKKYQIRRIERDPRTQQFGSQVRYRDGEIGLHPHS